jgi:hypothetical protein
VVAAPNRHFWAAVRARCIGDIGHVFKAAIWELVPGAAGRLSELRASPCAHGRSGELTNGVRGTVYSGSSAGHRRWALRRLRVVRLRLSRLCWEQLTVLVVAGLLRIVRERGLILHRLARGCGAGQLPVGPGAVTVRGPRIAHIGGVA